ncbi:TonB family protein [Pseudomonas syringae]|nr:TonB family protein [Pseudomonas syringae]
MKPALQLPALGLSFAQARAELPEPGVHCRFNVHSGDQAVKTAPIAFPAAAPHLRLLAPLRTPSLPGASPTSARMMMLILVPMVVAVHLLALWLSNAQPVPETVEPDKQTVVIHTGLAADPAIAAAARARAAAQAAEAQRQQAAEHAQAARQQAQLEASHLAEQARIQARQKAAPTPPVKPAAQRSATPPVQAPSTAPFSPPPTTAATTTQPAATPGATPDVPAGKGKQYVPLVKTAPDYPAAALENELEGDCTVEYDLLPNGTITAARLVKGLCDASHFGTASLKAAAGFRYSPQEADGHPVKVIGVRNTFHYRLQNAQ